MPRAKNGTQASPGPAVPVGVGGWLCDRYGVRRPEKSAVRSWILNIYECYLVDVAQVRSGQ